MSPKKVKITFLYLTLIAPLATTLAKILCEKDGNFTSRVEKERRHERARKKRKEMERIARK